MTSYLLPPDWDIHLSHTSTNKASPNEVYMFSLNLGVMSLPRKLHVVGIRLSKLWTCTGGFSKTRIIQQGSAHLQVRLSGLDMLSSWCRLAKPMLLCTALTWIQRYLLPGRPGKRIPPRKAAAPRRRSSRPPQYRAPPAPLPPPPGAH